MSSDESQERVSLFKYNAIVASNELDFIIILLANSHKAVSIRARLSRIALCTQLKIRWILRGNPDKIATSAPPPEAALLGSSKKWGLLGLPDQYGFL